MIQGFISIDDADVTQMFVRLDAAISPLGLATFFEERVDPYLQMRMRERFAQEGDDVTGPWDQLAYSTEEYREAGGYDRSHPINRRSGEMEDYLTENALIAPLGSGAFLQTPGRQATGELATKVKTAQQGKSKPFTRPRPVMGMNVRDKTEIMMLLAYFVGDVVVSGSGARV